MALPSRSSSAATTTRPRFQNMAMVRFGSWLEISGSDSTVVEPAGHGVEDCEFQTVVQLRLVRSRSLSMVRDRLLLLHLLISPPHFLEAPRRRIVSAAHTRSYLSQWRLFNPVTGAPPPFLAFLRGLRRDAHGLCGTDTWQVDGLASGRSLINSGQLSAEPAEPSMSQLSGRLGTP